MDSLLQPTLHATPTTPLLDHRVPKLGREPKPPGDIALFSEFSQEGETDSAMPANASAGIDIVAKPVIEELSGTPVIAARRVQFEKAVISQRCMQIFSLAAFEACFAGIASKCPDLKKIIKEDSATMHKQMIAWVIRCGLTGALWTAGYTAGAILDKADSSGATKSKTAWVCASVGQGLAEMLCVTFIGYFLSDPKIAIKSNSNQFGLKQNLMEGAFWGASCLTGGTLWQPAVNTLCSAEDLSKAMPLCMVKVGASTGATFGATLACIKALVTISQKFCKSSPGHFRPFSATSTIADSVLFGLIVVGTADAFFVMSSTESPFNHKPYSTSEEFQAVPVLTQMGLSALSTMLGGLTAYVIRGGLRSAVGLLDGDVVNALREYRREFSINSQCAIL